MFNWLRKHNRQTQSITDKEIGTSGEDEAAEYLRRQGYRIVNRNWKCSIGEIDIVCEHDDELVFIEVKSSRHQSILTPELRVHQKKRRKLVSLANAYLKSQVRNSPCRFEVVSVWWQIDKPQIRHIKDAFRP